MYVCATSNQPDTKPNGLFLWIPARLHEPHLYTDYWLEFRPHEVQQRTCANSFPRDTLKQCHHNPDFTAANKIVVTVVPPPILASSA